MKTYTEAFDELLKQNNMTVSPQTRDKHERALAQHPNEKKPVHRKSDAADLSLWNVKGIGPSIPLEASIKTGRHGKVRKHLSATGTIFALKTLIAHDNRDLEVRFKRERDALIVFGLLLGYEEPKVIGDKGLLAMPWHEGVTLREYVESHPKIEKDIDIALLFLEKVRVIHNEGYVHNALHEENLLIHEEGNDLNVYIVDYGRAVPAGEDDLFNDLDAIDSILQCLFQDAHESIRNPIYCMTHFGTNLDPIEMCVRMLKHERDRVPMASLTQEEALAFLFVSIRTHEYDRVKKYARHIAKHFGVEALNAEDKDGKRPVDYAYDFLKRDCYNILREAGASPALACKFTFLTAYPKLIPYDDAPDLSAEKKDKFHFFK